jgi:hypothetical protein
MTLPRTTIHLLALALVALVLRVALVLAIAGPRERPLDYEHGRIAANLLAGRGFTIEYLGVEGPTSQQAPFYPFFLAAVYGCLGVSSPAAIFAVQLIQCFAGAGLVLAAVWLGWGLLPERPIVGWVAGWGAALNPIHIYMATHLQVAPWAALALTVLLAVVVSPRWRATWQGAALAGVLSGLILLIEPILALSLPIAAVAFWLGESGGWRSRVRPVALARVGMMAVVAAVLIGPWIARNWAVHGEFVFIKSSFGYAFWQGNNAASWGTDKIPKATAEAIRCNHDGTLAGMDRALCEARHETLYIDDVLLKPGGYREFQGLSEPARSRLLGRRANEFIREHPDQYVRLCLQRLRYFLTFDETNPKAAHWVYRATTSLWLVLALAGLAATVDRWRRLWPTYAVFAAVTLFHTLVITSVRFRLPVEPLSLVWAAGAVAPLVERRLRRRTVDRSSQNQGVPFGSAHVLRGPHWQQGAGVSAHKSERDCAIQARSASE